MTRPLLQMAAAAVLCLWSAPVRAEPIAINAGSAVFDPLAGPGPRLRASLQNGDFSVVFRWDASAPCATRRCPEGTPVNLTATVVPVPPAQVIGITGPFENVAVGNATVSGVSHTTIAFAGHLTFTGPEVILPPVPPTDPPSDITFTERFTFGGSLSGFEVLGLRDPLLLFTTDLFGWGTMRARFIDGGPSHSYTLNRIDYEFEPVPEPSTLLLVSAGLAACARRRHRALRGTCSSGRYVSSPSAPSK